MYHERRFAANWPQTPLGYDRESAVAFRRATMLQCRTLSFAMGTSMRESEAFIRSLPLKRRFHDRNERRRYEIALVTAAKLIDDPATLKNGLAYMERHMRADPTQARYYALWADMISRDPKEIVRELLADTDRGALLRETSPVFYVLAGVERERALARAREEHQ